MKRDMFANVATLTSFVTAVTAVWAISPSLAQAQAKPAKSACGIKFLPLAVGNFWTYNAVAAPFTLSRRDESQSPYPTKTITVTVKNIETKGAETVVTLTEAIGDKTYEATITCGDKKLDISPNAFWFSGEAGGVHTLSLSNVERTGTTWALEKGAIGEKPWQEQIKATWQRTPVSPGSKPQTGKVEMVRTFKPGEREPIATQVASFNAEPFLIEITGQVTLDGAPAGTEPYFFKDGIKNTLWVADNVGVVQVVNSYAHMYTLAATNVGNFPKPVAPAATPTGSAATPTAVPVVAKPVEAPVK